MTKEEAYRRLWRGLAEEGLKDDFPLPERPYPGLEPFQETDAAVFFGRDDEIARVREVLNRRHRNNAKGFIVVLGASGCGKSSLVRAGVLPRLRRASGDDGCRRTVGDSAAVHGRQGIGRAGALAGARVQGGRSATRAGVRPSTA